jgi:hypothetical protein
LVLLDTGAVQRKTEDERKHVTGKAEEEWVNAVKTVKKVR